MSEEVSPFHLFSEEFDKYWCYIFLKHLEIIVIKSFNSGLLSGKFLVLNLISLFVAGLFRFCFIMISLDTLRVSRNVLISFVT